MPPTYTEQQWQDGNTAAPYGPISAARLTHMEDGIAAAQPPDTLIERTTYRPNVAKRETYSRIDVSSTSAATPLTSGTLFFCSIPLDPADGAITSITFHSGSTALAGGTHQWFGIFDTGRNMLATTTDDTTTAWGTTNPKTLNIAQIASGAAASYTPPSKARYLLGILVVATTMPNLTGRTVINSPGLMSLSPVLLGNSQTGLAGPPAFPQSYASPSGSQTLYPYAYVS
jgi:hypothetical protein